MYFKKCGLIGRRPDFVLLSAASGYRDEMDGSTRRGKSRAARLWQSEYQFTTRVRRRFWSRGPRAVGKSPGEEFSANLTLIIHSKVNALNITLST